MIKIVSEGQKGLSVNRESKENETEETEIEQI